MTTKSQPPVTYMTDDQQTLWENERVISLLGGIGYSEMNINNIKFQIIIVDGIPMEFRMFCMIVITIVSGGVYSFRTQMNNDISVLWNLLEFTNPHLLTINPQTWHGFQMLVDNDNTQVLLDAINKHADSDLMSIIHQVRNVVTT